MKITNKYQLPKFIVDFVSKSSYTGKRSENTFSVTTLLRPTQEIVLSRRHSAEIEKDITDMIIPWFGTAVHQTLSNIHGTTILPPERISLPMGMFGSKEWYLSGEFDLVEGETIFDFKTTSVGVLTNPYLTKNRLEEWSIQLSLYRYLYYRRYDKLLSDHGTIMAFFRDWKEKEVGVIPKYPVTSLITIELELKSIEEVEKFVKHKLADIYEAMASESGELPECSEEERWGKFSIKCKKYCDARAFCSQFKRMGESKK